MKYRVDITGSVQGVGCRFYCAKVGRRMQLRGAASNMPDGSVTVLIETSDVEEAKSYAEALRNNSFGIGFWGKIETVAVSQFKGVISGDYSF